MEYNRDMKNYTRQISDIQRIRNQQANLDMIRNNILDMNENFNIVFACLNGYSKDAGSDSIWSGYFESQEVYEDIREAVKHLNGFNKILIEDSKYHIGIVGKTLEECNLPGNIYNLHTGRKVCDKENPTKACHLDNIRTPKDLIALYESIDNDKVREALKNISLPEIDQNLDTGKWLEETWNKMHDTVGEVMVIESKAYTNFTI